MWLESTSICVEMTGHPARDDYKTFRTSLVCDKNLIHSTSNKHALTVNNYSLPVSFHFKIVLLQSQLKIQPNIYYSEQFSIEGPTKDKVHSLANHKIHHLIPLANHSINHLIPLVNHKESTQPSEPIKTWKTCSWRKGRENVWMTQLDLFFFWMKKLHLFFDPTLGCGNATTKQLGITFNTQVKTALSFKARSQNMLHKNCP